MGTPEQIAAARALVAEKLAALHAEQQQRERLHFIRPAPLAHYATRNGLVLTARQQFNLARAACALLEEP